MKSGSFLLFIHFVQSTYCSDMFLTYHINSGVNLNPKRPRPSLNRREYLTCMCFYVYVMISYVAGAVATLRSNIFVHLYQNMLNNRPAAGTNFAVFPVANFLTLLDLRPKKCL